MNGYHWKCKYVYKWPVAVSVHESIEITVFKLHLDLVQCSALQYRDTSHEHSQNSWWKYSLIYANSNKCCYMKIQVSSLYSLSVSLKAQTCPLVLDFHSIINESKPTAHQGTIDSACIDHDANRTAHIMVFEPFFFNHLLTDDISQGHHERCNYSLLVIRLCLRRTQTYMIASQTFEWVCW